MNGRGSASGMPGLVRWSSEPPTKPTSKPLLRYRLPNHSKVPWSDDTSTSFSSFASLRVQSPALCACGMMSTSSRSFPWREAVVEHRQERILLERNAIVAGLAEDHVVMAALRPLRRPLVAEEGDELAVVAELAHQPVELPPLAVVGERVVLGDGEEVEPRVVATELEEVRGRALPFTEPAVAVRLAPVDAAGIVTHPDRIAGPGHLAVGRLHA